MTIQTVLRKLQAQETQIVAEKGRFNLFALFLRDNAPANKWDLLVSADWAQQDKYAAIRYLAERLQSTLTPEELVALARIVVIRKENPALLEIYRQIQVEHGCVEMHHASFFGHDINHAYFISSQSSSTH